MSYRKHNRFSYVEVLTSDLATGSGALITTLICAITPSWTAGSSQRSCWSEERRRGSEKEKKIHNSEQNYIGIFESVKTGCAFLCFCFRTLLLSYHYPVTHTSKDSFISFLHSNCSFSFPRLFSEGRRGKEELGTLDSMMWSWGEDAALKNISKDGGLAQSSPLALLVLFLSSFETELQEKEEPAGEWQLLSGLLSAISLKLPLKTRRAPPGIQELQTQLLVASIKPYP